MKIILEDLLQPVRLPIENKHFLPAHFGNELQRTRWMAAQDKLLNALHTQIDYLAKSIVSFRSFFFFL